MNWRLRPVCLPVWWNGNRLSCLPSTAQVGGRPDLAARYCFPQRGNLVRGRTAACRLSGANRHWLWRETIGNVPAGLVMRRWREVEIGVECAAVNLLKVGFVQLDIVLTRLRFDGGVYRGFCWLIHGFMYLVYDFTMVSFSQRQCKLHVDTLFLPLPRFYERIG